VLMWFFWREISDCIIKSFDSLFRKPSANERMGV
jgi:hypothetical protein